MKMNERTAPSADQLTVEQIENEISHHARQEKFRRTIFSTVAILIVIAAAAYLVSSFLLPVLKVHSASMEPALQEGDIALCVKSGSFDTGDIMAFYYNNRILVRRVIGTPGDEVDIDPDGRVTVNGELLDEPYVAQFSFETCDIELPCRVDAESYFVMGDNRALAVDSRSTALETVGKDDIVGKVILRVWPLSEIGAVK